MKIHLGGDRLIFLFNGYMYSSRHLDLHLGFRSGH
jgi:hypothetical protein